MKSGIGHVLCTYIVIAAFSVFSGTNGQATCKDAITNCQDYDKDICKAFLSWAKTNCAKHCQLCTVVQVHRCPKGWTYHKDDDTCLRVFGLASSNNRHGFGNSMLECRISHNANLVIIRDPWKNRFVTDLIGTQCTWIGVRSLAKDKLSLEYVDGYKVGSYHPWYLASPPKQNKGGNRCWCLQPESKHSGKWLEALCQWTKPYVCEKPAAIIF